MYAVFKVQCWLMFYQPFKKKISFLLKSLVKPASILIRISPVFLFLIWRPPALPHRLQCSTIGRLGLNRRVREIGRAHVWTPVTRPDLVCRLLLARQVLSQLSYIPIWSGIHLLSHTVSSAVPSAACVLTVVFGMGTGVSHKRIDTRNMVIKLFSLITQQ